MTGYQNLVRMHRGAPEIIRLERAAWQAYVDYLISKMPFNEKNGSHVAREVQGDAESHRLFAVWREARRQRDAISNPRHKRDNIRFQRA